MIKINVVRNGLFLAPKSNWTEYLQAEQLTPNISSLKSLNRSESIPNTADTISASQVREDLLRVLASGKKKTWRILEYLAAAKSKEPQITLQDDLELAWFTVLRASEGNPDPWGFSFWMLYGKTYVKAMKAWAERDRQNERSLAKCAEIQKKEKQSCTNTFANIVDSPISAPCPDAQKKMPTNVTIATQTGNATSAHPAKTTGIGSKENQCPTIRRPRVLSGGSGFSVNSPASSSSGDSSALAGSLPTFDSGSAKKDSANLYDSCLLELSKPPHKLPESVQRSSKRKRA